MSWIKISGTDLSKLKQEAMDLRDNAYMELEETVEGKKYSDEWYKNLLIALRDHVADNLPSEFSKLSKEERDEVLKVVRI